MLTRPSAAEKIVQFQNDKNRGDVRQRTTFAYSAAEGLPYEQLIKSVRQVDAVEAVALHVANEVRADAHLVEATKACIRAGIVKRMDVLRAVNEREKCTRRIAEQILDKYTGTDLSQHHWTYDVQARGAKVYRLLQPYDVSVGVGTAPALTPREPGHE